LRYALHPNKSQRWGQWEKKRKKTEKGRGKKARNLPDKNKSKKKGLPRKKEISSLFGGERLKNITKLILSTKKKGGRGKISKTRGVFLSWVREKSPARRKEKFFSTTQGRHRNGTLKGRRLSGYLKKEEKSEPFVGVTCTRGPGGAELGGSQ